MIAGNNWILIVNTIKALNYMLQKKTLKSDINASISDIVQLMKSPRTVLSTSKL